MSIRQTYSAYHHSSTVKHNVQYVIVTMVTTVQLSSDSSVEPSKIVLLQGQASSFTLTVFGDPATVTVSNNEIQAVKNEAKSNAW